MMNVYFHNKEAIDLRAIETMGVSVKESKNPIGYFGTGLKFAIATLLRTGHKISLRLGGSDIIHFTSKKETIRGQEFDLVHMGDKPLGFTTALGKNWETWQAYRELMSNCMDEGGIASTSFQRGGYGTIFKVTGEAFYQQHRDRAAIFLDTVPLAKNNRIEIHPRKSSVAFYRGVRALDLSRPSLYTYNLLQETELTEDRHIRYSFYVGKGAEKYFAQHDDEEMIRRVLLAEEHSYEHTLDFESVGNRPSDVFMQVAGSLRENTHCNRGAIALWSKHSSVSTRFDQIELTNYHRQLFSEAAVFLNVLNVIIPLESITVVQGLGENILGCAIGGKIIIAERTFEMGARMLASTLYEEHLHAALGISDYTRDFQDHILEKTFSLADQLIRLRGER